MVISFDRANLNRALRILLKDSKNIHCKDHFYFPVFANLDPVY